MPSLTKNQETAIYEHSKPMIVSASAGSGKTFAMVQRAVDILLKKEATIDQLLIVTFTSASALEMKQRLYEALKKSDDPLLIAQLQDFSLADISSIDSFCQKILKKYFFEINLSPNFSIIDEMEAKFLKNTALTKTFQTLQKEKNPDFALIVEILTKKRKLQDLSNQILKVSEFADSLPDKEKYYNEIALSSYNTKLEENPCFIYLVDSLSQTVQKYINKLNEFLTLATGDEAIFIPYIEDTISVYQDFLKLPVLEKINAIEALKNVAKVPSKTTLKMQSQKDFQDKILKFHTACKKVYDYYNSCFEFGNVQKMQKNLQKSLKFAQSFIKTVILYEKNYESIKQEKFFIDFADLERKALQILNNDEICENISRSYKFVFIDEFQDTNNLQFQLLCKLCKYATPFYVGDPKQSIYGFRNCSPEILLSTLADFKQNHTEKMAVNFIENFRSDKSILDFSNFVFSSIMRLDTVDIDYINDGKFNTSKAPSFIHPALPNVHIGINQKNEDEEQEEIESQVYSVKREQESNMNLLDTLQNSNYTDLVVDYIKSFFDNNVQIFDKNLNAERKVQFSDFVILLRQRSSFDPLVNKLASFGFPVSVNLKLNLLECLEVKTLHNFLVVLSNSYDDYALANFLLSPLGKFTEEELTVVRLNYSEEEYFYSSCYKYAQEQNDELAIKLNHIFDILKSMRLKIQVQTISSVLYDVMSIFNLEEYWLAQPNGTDRLGKVNLFISILQNKSFNNSLSNYLNFTNLYKDAFFVNYSTVSSDNSITIMTIHNSKGLEFPVTIIGDCGKKFNSSKTETIMEDSNFGIALDVYNLDERTHSQTFIKNAILKYKIQSELKEEMRLLYVALTRAKYFLGIFGDYDIKKNMEKIKDMDIMSATNYLEWLLYPAKDIINPLDFGQQNIMENATLQIHNSVTQTISVQDKQLLIKSQSLNEKLEKVLDYNFNYKYPYQNAVNINIKNSVSKLLSSVNAEQEIINEEQNFINNETFVNSLEEASKRGTAYHKVMELVDFKNQNIFNQIESIKTNLASSITDYVNMKEVETAYKNLTPLINDYSNIYKEHKFMLYIPYNNVFKETNIQDKILVQGIIDIFIENQNEIILIDYKTNLTKNEQKLKDKYSLQLALYKMAVEMQYKKKVKVYIYSFAMSKLIEI